MTERDVLTRVRQSGEVERFVESHSGDWDHAAWLEFRDHIVQTFGPVPDDQLGGLLELEKQRYHSCRSQPARPVRPPWECPTCGDRLTTTHPSIDPPSGRTYCPRCELGVVPSYSDSILYGHDLVSPSAGLSIPEFACRNEPEYICPHCGEMMDSDSERKGDRGGPFDNVWITPHTHYSCRRCERAAREREEKAEAARMIQEACQREEAARAEMRRMTDLLAEHGEHAACAWFDCVGGASLGTQHIVSRAPCLMPVYRFRRNRMVAFVWSEEGKWFVLPWRRFRPLRPREGKWDSCLEARLEAAKRGWIQPVESLRAALDLLAKRPWWRLWG